MTKLVLEGELRQEPQYDAAGRLFRFELRDAPRQRVSYGTSEGALLATVIDDYPTSEIPTIPVISAQLAARRAYSIDLATAMQGIVNARFEDQRGPGAIDLLPEVVFRALHADKALAPHIRLWRFDLPQLVIPESSLLQSSRPAIPHGNVTLIRDLDEYSLLTSLAEAHRLRLVDRAADDAEEPW